MVINLLVILSISSTEQVTHLAHKYFITSLPNKLFVLINNYLLKQQSEQWGHFYGYFMQLYNLLILKIHIFN